MGNDIVDLEEMLKNNPRRVNLSRNARVIEIGNDGVKSYGNTNNSNVPARFTAKKGFLNDLQKRKSIATKSLNLFIASIALASSVATVKILIPQSPQIDTTNLKNISITDLDQTALDYREVDELIDFAEEYKSAYSSKKIDKSFLGDSYKKFYKLCGNVLRSKVSNITGTPKDDIAVVENNNNFRVVKGYVNDIGLVVVQNLLISNDQIPEDMLYLIDGYVRSIYHMKKHFFSYSHSKSVIKYESKLLNNYITELLRFSGSELIYDGNTYSTIPVHSTGTGREDVFRRKQLEESFSIDDK